MRRPANPEAFRRARERASKVIGFDEFAAKAPKKTKGLRSAGRSDVAQAMGEADAMRRENDWGAARARHFVALYALLHRHVYGVEPGELTGRTWTAACLAASRLHGREFGGDGAKLVSFMAWAWKREKRAAARGGEDRRRLGWRLQFSSTLVTDWRVEMARSKERRAAAE